MSAEDILQIIPANRVAATSAAWDFLNPCMPGFVKSMILDEHYVVVDDDGKRLPADQALKLIP